MDSIPDGVPGAIAFVLVTLITVIAARGTQRGAARAGEDAQRIDSGVVSTEALISLVRGYEERDAVRAREIHDLTERQAKTERDLNGMHDWKRAAIRYIRSLRDHGLRHSPEEQLPAPPSELVDDLREN